MASQIGKSTRNLRGILSGKYLQPNNKLFTQSSGNNCAKVFNDPKQGIHLSVKQDYPAAEALPMPHNIDPTESTRFSPQRARDITSSAIATDMWHRFDITVDATHDQINQSDPHVSSYDCRGAVNLNSSMQSNVPSPFGGMHKFTHLNMPGGQWEQGIKWLSHDLNSSHYTTLRREARKRWANDHDDNKGIFPQHTFGSSNILNAVNARNNPLFARVNANRLMVIAKRHFSGQTTGAERKSGEDGKGAEALSGKEKLKRAVKDYGVTVIVFHVSMSLASLGFCYQMVASGLDVVAILEYLGLSSISSSVSSNMATGASTFVIAYAVHKVFAPVRISVTLFSTPFIVRYLRQRGILKAKTLTK